MSLTMRTIRRMQKHLLLRAIDLMGILKHMNREMGATTPYLKGYRAGMSDAIALVTQLMEELDGEEEA